jgi:hypothetical protein
LLSRRVSLVPGDRKTESEERKDSDAVWDREFWRRSGHVSANDTHIHIGIRSSSHLQDTTINDIVYDDDDIFFWSRLFVYLRFVDELGGV